MDKALTDPKLENPKVSFEKLYRKARELGIDAAKFEQLSALKEIESPGYFSLFRALLKLFGLIFAIIFVCGFVLITEWPVSNVQLVNYWFEWNELDPAAERCAVEMIEIADYVRPRLDCSFCKGIKEVDRVANVTPEIFESVYAYSGRPVIITDAAKNWTALQNFSFEYFKKMYAVGSKALERAESQCNFFPYQTEFTRLSDVFAMDDNRVKRIGDSAPWYIGWSNCDYSAANELRSQYTRPYFLPKRAESSKTDWIFMGCPGHGAAIHIDKVQDPSWQAQIAGRKIWTLEPPPECYFQCEKAMQAPLNPGDIIVVDTNIWYHSTVIVGDDISISIGSEYD